MKKEVILPFILIAVPLLYGFSITFNTPSPNAVLTGVNSIEVILDFSTDANGNASSVYFYYRNFSEEYYLLNVNKSVNFSKYLYMLNASNLEDTLHGNINVTVSNYSNTLNISAVLPVSINNNAPLYSIIPNITLPEDHINDTLNISAYFWDTEKRNKFDYSASSIDDIEISINDDTGIARIEPDNNFSGIRYVRFTASDGLLSNTSNYVMINITNINDAPTARKIENRTWIRNTKTVIKVNEYFEDPDGDMLTYSSDVKGGNVALTMDPDGIATITPDTDFLGTESVVFYAYDGEFNASSNEVVLELIVSTANKAPVIDYAEPKEGSIELEYGKSKIFLIKKSDEDNDTLNVLWYLDNEKLDKIEDSYEFTADEVGKHNIKVEVSDGSEISMHSWDVNVSEGNNSIGNESSAINCGNGVVDKGENCGNCPQDVLCKDDEICKDNLCTAYGKESNLIVIILIIAGVLIATAVAAVVYYRKKQGELFIPTKTIKSSKENKSYFRGEIADQNFYRVKEARKEERPLVEIKKTGIDEIGGIKRGFSRTDEALLRSYVKMAFERGLQYERIKKNLLDKGWNINQVEKAIKEAR